MVEKNVMQQLEPQFSDEALQALANKMPVRDSVVAELVYLLRQLRSSASHASDMSIYDGVLLDIILTDLDDRVSARLAWLLDPNRPPLLESVLGCHLAQ